MIVIMAMTSRFALASAALVLVAACAPPPTATVVPVPLDPPPGATAMPVPDASQKAPVAPAPKPAPQPVDATAAKVQPVDVAPTGASYVTSADLEALREAHLLIPVAGVPAKKLEDSFNEPRDGDRQHNAIDILAPRNTPILAADDGTHSSGSGAPTSWAESPCIPPATAGRFVRTTTRVHGSTTSRAIPSDVACSKASTLGPVGTTGNAPKDTPHLHFQIMRWPPDGKYCLGEPIDPFPFLRAVNANGNFKNHW